MALFSMRVQVISRKDGRSAVGAAAYRAGVSLSDAHGNSFDYTSKDHVELSRIMAPEGAPAWVFDRGTLWRTAEAAEKRKDAQLAREIRIMIPREFTPDQRINVVSAFIQREFVDRGMVADVSWHNPRASDGRDNPHVHIMLTMRPLDGDGFGKKSVGGRATQARTTDWNKRELYENIRKAWEDTANTVLADSGSEARIDRRSFLERGLSRLPQPYLGVAKRIRSLKDRMVDRYNQFIAHRAHSRTLAFAKQALDSYASRSAESFDTAADVYSRFMEWIDEKTTGLGGGADPPNRTRAPLGPRDEGIDL